LNKANTIKKNSINSRSDERILSNEIVGKYLSKSLTYNFYLDFVDYPSSLTLDKSNKNFDEMINDCNKEVSNESDKNISHDKGKFSYYNSDCDKFNFEFSNNDSDYINSSYYSSSIESDYTI